MESTIFEVRKDDLSDTRTSKRPTADLADGEILCRVDRFALTANNVTYGVTGDKLGYWRFFPAAEGWGVIPVWGFADVVESRHAEVPVGERLYGYWPTGTHLVMRPDRVRAERLQDGAAHRSDLPAVYNAYARTAAESRYDPSMDDERMLLFPLYATSFCLWDFLVDNDYFGAAQVIVTSASSKTAIGLGYALADDDASPPAIGLTSPGNAARVQALGLYDDVVTYDRLDDVDSAKPTVIVDMSGNGQLLSDLHRHLGDNMRYTTNVGLTHIDAPQTGPDYIRERSAMFFAPSHIAKRAKDWGPGEFEKRALRFWYGAARRSRSWLSFDRRRGMDELADVYQELLAGRIAPDRGIVVEL